VAKAKATKTAKTAKSANTTKPTSPEKSSLPTNPLDMLLPRLEVSTPSAYRNVAILEVTDAARLVELAADSKIRRFLLGRLSDTIALIDPGQEDACVKALLAGGHTPKVVNGEAQ